MSNFMKDLLQLQKDLEEVKNDIPIIKADVAEKAAAQWYEDLDSIFIACIDKFYADYKPTFYRREGSLYYTYKLTNKNGNVFRDFGPQYMPQSYKHTHRVSNEYIYNQMFLQGYHGGAHTISPDKEEQWGEHPEDGTPWYRTPYPKTKNIIPYTEWSERAAAQSTPPAKDIEEQLEKYENGELTIIGRTASDAVDSAWDLVLNRYNLFNNY